MKKMFFAFLLAASFSNSFAIFTLYLSLASVEDELKVEVVINEAITHLASGEIVEPSDSLKLFLKRAKTQVKGKSDLQILEQLIEEAEAQKN
jgi:hypothetical protein